MTEHNAQITGGGPADLMDFVERASGVRGLLGEIFGETDASLLLRLARAVIGQKWAVLTPPGAADEDEIFPAADVDESARRALFERVGARADLRRAFMDRRRAVYNPDDRQLLAFESYALSLWDEENDVPIGDFSLWVNFFTRDTYEPVGYAFLPECYVGSGADQEAIDGFEKFRVRPCLVTDKNNIEDELFNYFVNDDLQYLLLDWPIEAPWALEVIEDQSWGIGDEHCREPDHPSRYTMRTERDVESAWEMWCEDDDDTMVRHVWLHCTFDQDRYDAEAADLRQKLEDIRQKLAKERRGLSEEEKEFAGNCLLRRKGKWILNEAAVRNRLKTAGWSLRISRVALMPKEVVEIEETYKAVDHRMDIMSAYDERYLEDGKSLEESPAMQGRLFVQFVAQCLASHARRRIRAVRAALKDSSDPQAELIRKVLLDAELLDVLRHLGETAEPGTEKILGERFLQEFSRPL